MTTSFINNTIELMAASTQKRSGGSSRVFDAHMDSPTKSDWKTNMFKAMEPRDGTDQKEDGFSREAEEASSDGQKNNSEMAKSIILFSPDDNKTKLNDCDNNLPIFEKDKSNQKSSRWKKIKGVFDSVKQLSVDEDPELSLDRKETFYIIL